jgi:hypothetical protein
VSGLLMQSGWTAGPDGVREPRPHHSSGMRKRKPSEFHSEVTRERIRAGVIIDRFQKHFAGVCQRVKYPLRPKGDPRSGLSA